MSRRKWTQEELDLLRELYKTTLSVEEVANKLGRTKGSVVDKARSLNIKRSIPFPTDATIHRVYQDYDWFYERYIEKGMTLDEMAVEAGCTLRVISKWAGKEKHNINQWTFKKLKKLSDVQRQVIISGRLGDGHIDRREDQPNYIESHAENQKEYLFWKYELLKDLCNKPPVYVKPQKASFSTDKMYECQASYRLQTRIIDDLKSIRSMSNIDLIRNLDEFGICLYFLDDGSRSSSNWDLCVAGLTIEDKQELIEYLRKFGFNGSLHNTDDRYLKLDADSSRRLDKIMLDKIPNDIDIIKDKIINKEISEPANYRYVLVKDDQIGLSTYCKRNHIVYEKIREVIDLDKNIFNEQEILDLWRECCA